MCVCVTVVANQRNLIIDYLIIKTEEKQSLLSTGKFFVKLQMNKVRALSKSFVLLKLKKEFLYFLKNS